VVFRLAHLSDPHLGPLPKVGLADLASKRVLGFINWQRNRERWHAPAVLVALVDDILLNQPNHVAVTGDLVNLALPEEFERARDWLGAFGEPADVTVVPGNHDTYVPGALAELSEIWHPFMTGDGAGDKVVFPFIRRRGPVAIVGVSSAIPTAPFMATGEIGGGQAAALASRLAALGRAGLFRVVLIHHPPFAGGAANWSRRLIDADLFRQAIADSGAELILHGHHHHSSVASLRGRDGPVPVVGGAAASRLPQNGKPGGSYCLFDIDEGPDGFTCTMTERGVRTGLTVETLATRRFIGAGEKLPDQPGGKRTQA
jgi:3',5'-cyclic AMP phosphodiesterase CpdA